MSVGDSLSIKVNNVSYPQVTPGGYGNEPEVIVRAKRNTLGTAIIDVIAAKRKIYLTFPLLSGAQYALLYQAHKTFTNLLVYCWDPDTRTYKTYSCYPNTVTGRMRIPPPNEYWEEVAINFIEQ